MKNNAKNEFSLLLSSLILRKNLTLWFISIISLNEFLLALSIATATC